MTKYTKAPVFDSNDQFNINNRVFKLAMEIGKARVASYINGSLEESRGLWEIEKQVHILEAKLTGKKLREGFAES